MVYRTVGAPYCYGTRSSATYHHAFDNRLAAVKAIGRGLCTGGVCVIRHSTRLRKEYLSVAQPGCRPERLKVHVSNEMAND